MRDTSLELMEWVAGYGDREMDVADARIVMMAEANPGLRVLTVDRKDFSLYRTRRGKAIRCEFPP
ncbi:MAG TPA: hypothetical protein VK633_03955 [Verrucomicrobiae bacterium]|nr:hypothetical protein [Verrucomicrobiae bacterium]